MQNPWMSWWLSAANSWMGASQGLWTAAARRQQNAMIKEMNQQILDFWTAGWRGTEAHKTRSRKRRD